MFPLNCRLTSWPFLQKAVKIAGYKIIGKAFSGTSAWGQFLFIGIYHVQGIVRQCQEEKYKSDTSSSLQELKSIIGELKHVTSVNMVQ